MRSIKRIQRQIHLAVYTLSSVILIAIDQQYYFVHWVNYTVQRIIYLIVVTIHTKLVTLIIFVISKA